MAIRRCPYCKAIIDEGSEYCSNCGTQLLFPEDEFIDEEIPGEKIVEEDTPEEDNPKKKRSSSGRRKKKEEQQEFEPVEPEEEAELGKDEEIEKVELEPVEDEVIEEDIEVEAGEEEAEEEILEDEIPADMQEMEEPDEEEKIEESRMEEESEEIEKPIEEDFPGPQEPERDEYFVEKKESAFSTEDLEKVIDPEEKEKVEIEKFLRSLKEDREEWNGEIPPTDELPPWAEKIKDEQPEKPPAVEAEAGSDLQDMEESYEELTEEEEPEIEHEEREEADEENVAEMEILVPRGMTPEDEVPEIKIPDDEFIEEEIPSEEAPIEDTFEEIASEKEETIADTGMGLPEGVEQESLPFDEKSSVNLEGQEKSPPFKLPNWIKSRAFDVLFIAALWIVTLHIASRMLSTNLFRLIAQSIFPSIAFYLVLLAVYLFLFFLFLGQTLGDHLFPYEE